MKAPTLYFRADVKHDDSVIKTEVYDDNGLRLDYRELQKVYETKVPINIGTLLHLTIKTLSAYGMPKDGIQRVLSGKQCFLPGTTPPINELERLGWEILPYPHKFLCVADTNKVFVSVQATGIILDVSNIVLQKYFEDTKGLVLKSVVDLLDAVNIRLYLCVDHSLYGRLKQRGWNDVRDYIDSFYKAPWRRIVTSRKGQPADEIMLRQADMRGWHILSRDEFDEYDTQYDWVLHGAENGNPRLHKFIREGDTLVIPDLGIGTKLATTW